MKVLKSTSVQIEDPKANMTIEDAMKVYQNKFKQTMEERHGNIFEGGAQEAYQPMSDEVIREVY